MRAKPKTSRVATVDVIRALVRVVVHLGAADESVLKDHASDMGELERFMEKEASDADPTS